MIFGDPYSFSVIAERVNEWNRTEYDDNGFAALCISGRLFPGHLINAVINTSFRDILDVLKSVPEDGAIEPLSAKEAFQTIYERVFPADSETDNDYSYLLSPYALTDEGCFVFAVKSGSKIRIMGAELEYDIDNSRHDLNEIDVAEADLSEEYIQSLIQKMESEG